MASLHLSARTEGVLPGVVAVSALAGGLATAGGWPPSGLALAIGLLTLFVATIVALFSLRFMRADRASARFFMTLGALVATVLAFVFTGNLLVLGLAWCASGWLLAALIGHARHWPEARAAARRTRATLALGDAALVGALALLGWQAHTLQLDQALAASAALPAPLASAAALLLVIAAAARCALPPLAGWLLSSMTAPTPVSALMHAGMVNAGGFLLIRCAPLLEAAPLARTGAVLIGLAGAIYGLGVMLVRPDVKRSLAGSTVSQMGFMIMSCGLGAYAAALWHIIAHGLFKAWLFLGAGSAIGIRSGRPAAMLPGRATLAIAAATLALALILLATGQGQPSLVPLLLGLATAGATLASALAGKAPLRGKLGLVLVLAGMAGLHGAGLHLAGLAVSSDAAPLVPEWTLLALLIVFLAAWAWQQHLIASGRGLPLRLYVHLINAGALPAPARTGASQ